MTECFLWLLGRSQIRMQGLAANLWLVAHDDIEPGEDFEAAVRATICRWLPCTPDFCIGHSP